MVIPTHYSLTFDLSLEEMSFSGSVSIDLLVDAETSRIELDSSGLTIDRAALLGQPVAVETGPASVTLVAAEPYAAGVIKADLTFRGRLQSAGPGLFLTGPFAVTHLQPSGASRL